MVEENIIYDVIIIGCGASGIGAGIEFEKMKLKYLILEGRNRIGGRAYTDISTFGKDIPIDIGAHYICHHQENNILKNYYIPSDKDFIDNYIYDQTIMKIFDQNGNLINQQLYNQSMEFVEDLLLFIKQYSNENDDISIYDLIYSKIENIPDKQMKNVVKMCLSYTELHEGSDLNQLSSKYYGKGEGNIDESDLSIYNGLGELVNKIALNNNLSIKLNSIVSNIKILNELINILTIDMNSYLCKYVLLTIPLGCLKSKSIIFNPSLPQWKENAIQNMGYGLLNKIYLQFSQIFWQINLRKINIIHEKFQFYYCLPEYKILSLYVSGYIAKQLENLTDQQIIEQILDSLQKIYPQITYPIKWLITRWGKDPFSNGSYSSFHQGNNNQTLKQLSQETHHGKIHWAGEHTNFDGSIGYVDSAFQTGFREANKIIQKIQFQSNLIN